MRLFVVYKRHGPILTRVQIFAYDVGDKYKQGDAMLWIAIRQRPAPCSEEEVERVLRKMIAEVLKTCAQEHLVISFLKEPLPKEAKGIYVEVEPWVSRRESLRYAYIIDEICLEILKREKALCCYKSFEVGHPIKHPADEN